MMISLDDFSDSYLLTVSEAAVCLRVGADLVYTLVHRGELPAVRLGRKIRIPAFGLRQWIATRAGVSAPPTPHAIISRQIH
jgi:excisionase family DNA binding protein